MCTYTCTCTYTSNALQPVHNLHIPDILLTYLQDHILLVCHIGAQSCQVIYLYPLDKSICHPVLFTFDVSDLEIKLIDCVQPSSLPGVQIQLVKQIS